VLKILILICRSDRIALRPAEPRESAQLLVVKPDFESPFSDFHVYDLARLLRAGDCLVVNNTKVLPARLVGKRQRGVSIAGIEATLHKRESEMTWRAFVRPAKKLALGETVQFQRQENGATLTAEVIEKGDAGEVLFRFGVAGEALDAAIRSVGVMPLPPYIATKRTEDDRDERDYQTMFADRSGAVAAPTAGLHFTPDLIKTLRLLGIHFVEVTLHVGAGTFLPVKVDDTDDHKMHAEWGEMSSETAHLLNLRDEKGGVSSRLARPRCGYSSQPFNRMALLVLGAATPRFS